MGIDKYYTPELEELHFGFECEVYNSTERYMFEAKNGWIKTCIGIVNELRFMPTILSLINDSQIRVKYLDREDIEECGWEKSGTENDLYSINWIENPTERENAIWLKQFDGNRLQIIDSRHKWHVSLFHGTIKNKSELKKLMKQLNICTK